MLLFWFCDDFGQLSQRVYQLLAIVHCYYKIKCLDQINICIFNFGIIQLTFTHFNLSFYFKMNAKCRFENKCKQPLRAKVGKHYWSY